jgi:hypothetical protein
MPGTLKRCFMVANLEHCYDFNQFFIALIHFAGEVLLEDMLG